MISLCGVRVGRRYRCRCSHHIGRRVYCCSWVRSSTPRSIPWSVDCLMSVAHVSVDESHSSLVVRAHSHQHYMMYIDRLLDCSIDRHCCRTDTIVTELLLDVDRASGIGLVACGILHTDHHHVSRGVHRGLGTVHGNGTRVLLELYLTQSHSLDTHSILTRSAT